MPSTPHDNAPRPTRRALLTSAALAGAAGLGGWVLRPEQVVASAPGGHSDTQLQVIAHPDDDLFFFNPAIVHALQSGLPLVNVCLTSGEANGRNGHDDLGVDYAGYASARQLGLRRAYAAMAADDADSPWETDILRMSSGPSVELNTLIAVPTVQLVFFGMWVDSSKLTGTGRRRMADLWNGDSDSQLVLTATGSSLPDNRAYSRQTLLDNLTELLDIFQPTMIRTLDPDPDAQVHDDEDNPQGADQKGLSDHVDHTAAALFAWEAAQHWSAASQTEQPAQIQAYRGYYNRRWPRNLGEADKEVKGRYLDIYSTRVDDECEAFSGCGDKHVYTDGTGDGFGASTTMRYPGGTDWLQLTDSGRLSAVTVAGFRAVRLDEPESGGDWHSTSLDSPPLLPHTCVLTDPDDRLLTVGVETQLAALPSDQVRRVALADVSQDSPEWETLGNPNTGSLAVTQRGMGKPTAAFDESGNLHVATRTFGRNLALRIRDTSGEWTDWRSVNGGLVQEGVAALGMADGTVQFYAAHERGITRWREVSGTWRHNVLDVEAPASPPTMLRLPDDRSAMIVRAEGAQVEAYLADADGDWGVAPINLGSPGGTEAIAAIAPATWDGAVALAARDEYGVISFASWDPGSEEVPQWHSSGPQAANLPSLACDADDRVVVAVMGVDGCLHIARQVEAGGEPPTNWNSVA